MPRALAALALFLASVPAAAASWTFATTAVLSTAARRIAYVVRGYTT